MSLPALLRWLDRRLDAAVRTLAAEAGATPDPFRGLYVTETQARNLLAAAPCPKPLPSAEAPEETDPNLDAIAQTFHLTEFDVRVILLALAVEIDLKYERIYGFLQDDVTRKRPTVDLALHLFCVDAEDRLARRERFAPGAPLRAHLLIRMEDEESRPLLGRPLELDPQIVAFLLGQNVIDERLAQFVELWAPASVAGRSDGITRAATLLRSCSQERQPICLHIQGSPSAARETLRALGAELAEPILAADAVRAAAAGADFSAWLQVFFREAWFRNALPAIEGIDRLEDHPRHTLIRELGRLTGVVLLTGQHDWRAGGEEQLPVLSLAVTPPDWNGRREAWEASLAAAGLRAPAPLLDRLASGFRLDRDQIRDAVATARHAMRFNGGLEPAHLFAAARAGGGHALAQLARKVDPIYGWSDLVLPPDTTSQLRELCHRAVFRHQVLEHWGFAGKLSGGKGISALFTGSSGTGKTMAAEVVAGELQLELYKINLATVVSKYIGETEKNLDRIFTAAEGASAILFFDEADALFGKRSEVRDSHDRYANLEISYLLQKMEEYEGIAILASNLRQNLDDAFIRRLSFSVSFPFPDESSRRKIWRGIWPARLPLDESADLDYMARTFKLSGGNIRNVALAASFTAASDGGRVTMAHLLAAIRREYQKLGKAVSQEELNRAFSAPSPLEATA